MSKATAPDRRRGLGPLVPYALAIGLVAYASVWSWQNWPDISQAFTLLPGYLIALVPAIVVSQLVVGLVNQLAAAHLGADLRASQWISLALASTFANHFLPMRAGAVLRAAYLSRCWNLSVARFASTMLVVYVIGLLANCVGGLSALAWYYFQQQLTCWPLVVLYILVSLGCAAVMFIPAPLTDRRPVFSCWKIVAEFHDGWQQLRGARWLPLHVAALSTTQMGLTTLRLYLSFAAVGHTLKPAGCLLIATLASMSTFLAITPGGLGVQEAAIVFTSLAIGVTPQTSLLAAVVHRAVLSLVVLAIGPFGLMRISHELGRGHGDQAKRR